MKHWHGFWDAARADFVEVVQVDHATGKTSSYLVHTSQVDATGRGFLQDKRVFPQGQLSRHSHEVRLPDGSSIYFRDTNNRVWVGSDAQVAARDHLNAVLRDLSRVAESGAAKSKKQSLISQAASLASSSDLRAASDQMKQLRQQFKDAGHAGRDERDLRDQFERHATALFERSKRERERAARQAEAARRKADYEARKAARSSSGRSGRQVQSWQEGFFGTPKKGKKKSGGWF